MARANMAGARMARANMAANSWILLLLAIIVLALPSSWAWMTTTLQPRRNDLLRASSQRRLLQASMAFQGEDNGKYNLEPPMINTSTASSTSGRPLVKTLSGSTAPATTAALILSITSIIMMTMTAPVPANAIKPRNEALCNTGLFENFLEFRCTPLGNIEDEGYSKAMSKREQAMTDSLLSKLSFSSDGTTETRTERTDTENKDTTIPAPIQVDSEER